MTPDIIMAVLTIRTDNLPENFSEILVHERALVDRWKHEGILERLYLRPARNGAVLLFKNVDEQQVHHLMSTLPLAPFAISIEVIPLLSGS